MFLAARRTSAFRSLPSYVFSSARCHQSAVSSAPAANAQLSPRWLSDVKTRVGACITFGLTPPQLALAGSILEEIAEDWRELVAGSEGFLTSPTRRGLHRWPVAWGEQDSMGHVNNVTYNRYAESGRIAWVQNYARHIDPEHRSAWENLGTPKGEIGMILRKITTEFKFPMMFPDHISVYHKLHAAPGETDALLLDVLILSELHQRPAARLYEDCALYDYRIGRKAAMPPWMARAFEETWKLQEEAKRKNSARVWGLLDRVRLLETESWDRVGAVEDMGSGR